MNNFMFFALIIVLLGIIFDEKLIALEDWIADRIGWLAAQVVITYRKVKRNDLPFGRSLSI